MKRFILWVGVSVLSLACTINSYAATLQVYPVTLGFCGKESAQAIYVRNTGILVHNLRVSVCLTRGLCGGGLLPVRRMYLPFLLSLIDLFAKVRSSLTADLQLSQQCPLRARSGH